MENIMYAEYGRPTTDTQTRAINGTITRVAEGSVAVVYVKLDGKDKTVAFTPRVLRGFRGENLADFGLRQGRKVAVECDFVSGIVRTASLIR